MFEIYILPDLQVPTKLVYAAEVSTVVPVARKGQS